MVKYREVIYNQYFSNQVNKLDVDQHRLLDQQVRHNTRELIHLLPKNKDSVIVDLGCGFGGFVRAALSAGYPNTSGYDISAEQVATAHQLGLHQIEHMSIDDFFAKNQKADVIVGLDIIEHFTKDELIDFLSKAKEALNPGGKMILRTPNMDAPHTSVFAFGDLSHETFLNKSSALQVMHSVGFRNVEVMGGLVFIDQPVKEFFRNIIWKCYLLWMKVALFSSARTWHNVVFEPNLVIEAQVD